MNKKQKKKYYNKIYGSLDKKLSKKKRAKITKKLLKESIESVAKRSQLTLSKGELVTVLPEKYKGDVSDSLLENINEHLLKSASGEELKDLMISFGSVMSGGKYTVQQYIDAVRFTHFKTMNFTNKKCYSLVFPKRMRQMKKDKYTKREINGRVSGYFRGKLVQDLMVRTIIPPSVAYQDLWVKALMKQVSLMDSSNKIAAQKAADSVLSHLSPNNNLNKKDSQMNIGSANISVVGQMFETMIKIGQEQRAQIIKGTQSPTEIVSSDLTTSYIEKK